MSRGKSGGCETSHQRIGDDEKSWHFAAAHLDFCAMTDVEVGLSRYEISQQACESAYLVH